MATDKQLAANRENAKRCTGPTSPEGLARSSQNALKHGLDSKSEVMRCESKADYEALIAEYYARFHPTVPEERALVDMLIKSEWHSRRYMSIDAGVWERGFVVTGDLSLGRIFEMSGKTLDRVDRRINSAQRNFQKALKQLTDLRAKRANEPVAPEIAAEPALTRPAEPAPTLSNRDCEGAALETSGVATEPLNPKLVSFLPTTPNDLSTSLQPGSPLPEATAAPREKENIPPIAA